MAINLGIDHGNKNIKTSTGDVFPAGYKKHHVKPVGKDVLEFGGAYYTLTNNRIPFTWDKTQNEDFFILTLFAIARHLEYKGQYALREESFVEVNLGVGLPPAHFGRLYEQFQAYFQRPRNGGELLDFKFRGKTYYIYINKVFAFVQGYAAALMVLEKLENNRDVAVIDIGGMTLDYLLLHDSEPDGEKFGSLEAGIILLYNPLKEWIEGNYGLIVSDENIDEMLQGVDVLRNADIMRHVKQAAGDYVENSFGRLRERQLDLRVTPAVIIGGGAVTLKHYLEPLEAVDQPFSLLEDVCANARGYEQLLKAAIYREQMAGDNG